MARYRKRPVDIDAVQWDGTPEGATSIIGWIASNDGTARYCGGIGVVAYLDNGEPVMAAPHIAIDTLEGTMAAGSGDWIIRGVKGEFYPCKPDVFEASYEPAPDEKGNPDDHHD